MKRNIKILIVFGAVLILIISLSFNLYLWKETELLNVRITNKDKAITEIRNSVKAITATHNSADSILAFLSKEFIVNSEIIHRETDSTFYFVITPIDWNKVDNHEIWDFYGLEIVFDNERKFKQIDFYKP